MSMHVSLPQNSDVTSNEMLSLRIVTADHYMAAPIPGLDVTYSDFRATEVEQVPVIRLFGSNSQGIKTCVHVHGVFPYICIPYDSVEPHTKLSYQIAVSLDKAINISLGNSSSQTKHVHKIILVSGIPFYGYHGKEHQFLKIYFYKPAIMKKAVSLLENGAVLSRVFQPHEAHVAFMLQFFIDFNLYGMSYIHFANGRFRNTGSSAVDALPKELVMPDSVKPMSTSKLEADVVSSDILNPTIKQAGSGVVNPGLAAIWEDEKERRLEDGVTETPRLHSQRQSQPPTDSDAYYREKIMAKLESLHELKDSLSGESLSGGRISYPSETPAGRNILEASFVSVHSGQLVQPSNETTLEPDLDESVVDEEVVKNLNSSQISQRLNCSQLDEDDLELLMVMESLAHHTTQTVDANSALGSQPSEVGEDPDKVELDPDEDEGDSWLDRTLIGEGFEEENLRRETPVTEDNASQHSNPDADLPWEESFWNGVNCSYLMNEDQIPQLDGANEDEEEWAFPVRKKFGTRGRVPTGSRNRSSRVREAQTGVVDVAVRHMPEICNSASNDMPETRAPSTVPVSAPAPASTAAPAFQEGSSTNSTNITDLVNPSAGSSAESEEVGLEELTQPMNDYSVHNSIRNNSCSNEKQIIDYETDQSVRAKKKLQFSFLSESSFGFEEVSEINENDMTLGLPLSQDDEDSLSQHSSVDMFEETILERTLCENTLSLEKADYFIPVALPPSRSEVAASLATLDIPETINPTPYFSNYQDVKRKKEVGGTVLHLCSRNIVDLEEFQSNVISRGINEQQKTLFKLVLDTKNAKANRANIASSLVSDRAVHITPVKLPPSVKEVKVWSRARAILQQEKRNPVKPKTVTKVSAPMSPGVGLSQESDDMLNISQCSSLEITTPESVKSTQHSTPQSESNRSSGVELQPPRRTPILRRPSKPRRNTRRLSVEPTLASIKEDSDGSLAPSPDSQDSSLRRLLLSSQFKNQVSPLSTNMSDISCLQIEGLNRSKDFRVPLENLQHVRNTSEHQFTTLLILELHICVCGELKPDPERDPIRAVFYTVVNDVPEDSSLPRLLTGVIAVDSPNPSTHLLSRIGLQVNVTYSADEVSLLKQVIEFVHEWDPDIVAGYEIEMLSWGYLIDRANTLGVNLKSELSRVVTDENSKQKRKEGVDSEGDGAFHGGLNLIGRVVIDVWRLMRNEVALQSYSFENIAYHILHQRLPLHSLASLSFWWEHSSHLYRWRTVQHYLNRVTGIARILDQLDFIGRTSELARLFGIQFFEVLSRGSQFRVESMMLRLAKPLNFVAISPSVQQRARMRAPEMLPLIMEPESRFYSDPVIVLDFQSLYPSMIIAYNYCFSTCLGRVEHLGKCSHYEFGCCHLYVPPGRLKKLTVSPCGVAFVKPEVRRGVLPQMLEEILEARLAVKDSMKRHRDDRTLQRVLHARQLGLKLIANVTYGYTSANFSGRMPCIEVGDSVVSKGRETLERAITTVQSNENWRARVVYGDTDSLFVLVPGRSREEAFRIGAEIAEAVTQQNPSPVKLKLEKVYQPCILQTKKRYVGYMYESPNQKEPVYDAKGIETVRRDGCPAVAKMLEKTLRILFETADVSLVKSYVCRQFTKMFKGRTNLQDFIYAKEYRGMANYRPGACVPALELTRRWLAKDRRSEPRITERVPYVIVNGPPGLPLIHLVRSPRDVVADPGLRLNVVYYITRAIIPPLERCLALIGADVLSWYTDLPRKKAYVYTAEGQNNARKNTISQYFCTVECVCCGQLTNKGICVDCRKRPQHVALQLSEKLHSWEHSYNTITKVCQSCIGSTGDVNCVSLDCPILYRRLQTSREYEHSNIIRRLKDEF